MLNEWQEIAILLMLGTIALLALLRGRRILTLEAERKLLQDKVENQEWILKEQARMLARKAKQGYQILKGGKVDQL